MAGYRLYASVRYQRTQARSRPLSSSRVKATAAGTGGGTHLRAVHRNGGRKGERDDGNDEDRERVRERKGML